MTYLRSYPSKLKVKHKRAVFVDRDGTINVDTHYPHKIEDLIVMEEAIEGLKLLSKLPLDIIVISNQGGIAAQIFTYEQMILFNNELLRRIEKHGARIDAFYFCPHLERKNLKGPENICFCSKTGTGNVFRGC